MSNNDENYKKYVKIKKDENYIMREGKIRNAHGSSETSW